MSIGLLFWIIWLLVLIFGGAGIVRTEPPGRWIGGVGLAVWVELGLLGWKVFGSPLHG